MGKEIYNIINDMAEVLNASQMQNYRKCWLIVCRKIVCLIIYKLVMRNSWICF